MKAIGWVILLALSAGVAQGIANLTHQRIPILVGLFVLCGVAAAGIAVVWLIWWVFATPAARAEYQRERAERRAAEQAINDQANADWEARRAAARRASERAQEE